MLDLFLSHHGDDRDNRHGREPAELQGIGFLGIGDLRRCLLAQRVWVFFTLSEGHVQTVAGRGVGSMRRH